MAKAKVKAVKEVTGISKRAGYKRKSNKRVDVLGAQLKRLARKAIAASAYKPKTVREDERKARAK